MKCLCYVLHRYDSDAFTETGLIKPLYEVVRYLLNKCISFLTNVLTSSFPQSMIARLVLNLLKSRETIAMLPWSKAFDAFPLWQSRIFSHRCSWNTVNLSNDQEQVPLLHHVVHEHKIEKKPEISDVL